MSEDTWLGDDVVPCDTCWGTGEVVACIDDLCHGTGECIHEGNQVCPDCEGTGELGDRIPMRG